MADESFSTPVDSPLHAELPARPDPAAPETAEPESRTRGLLRDAIQKVMAEITYHENEAKKHKQQAEELRRDLRESFAFLQQGRGDKAKSSEVPAETTAKAKESPPEEKAPRGGVKKKPTGKK